MERSVVVIWFLWGQKWIVAFRCGTFLFVLIIIIKYCDWRRTDVGPTSAGDINPTSKRCWADIARPISTQRRPNTCSLVVFFSLDNLPELLGAEIVPMLEATINSGPGMVTDLPILYTNMKTWFISTHWGPDKMDAILADILKCIFLNANIWISIKFSLKFLCKGPIDNIYQRWFR